MSGCPVIVGCSEKSAGHPCGKPIAERFRVTDSRYPNIPVIESCAEHAGWYHVNAWSTVQRQWELPL